MAEKLSTAETILLATASFAFVLIVLALAVSLFGL